MNLHCDVRGEDTPQRRHLEAAPAQELGHFMQI